MATQPATQRAPKTHEVHIVYEVGKEKGQVYEAGKEKGQELEVQGYPPVDLQKGDKVVFIPSLPGELKLTFEYGSVFEKEGIDNYQIVDQEPKTVEREMTEPELKKFMDRATKEAWSPKALAQVKKNAFPFMCELTLKGGFPKRP